MDPNNNPETIKQTSIKGVFEIIRPVFPDDRGSFQEVVRIPELEKEIGYEISIQQINKSVNKKDVLRGLHIAPWGKLIHCYIGNVFQVVVDARKNSPTFGEVYTCVIGESNPKTVWVPPFCANGFCVINSEIAIYSYSVTAVFEPGKEICVQWNDPELASKINWPVANPIVSERDRSGILFKDIPDLSV